MSVTIHLDWPANPTSEGIEKYQVLQSKDLAPYEIVAETAETELNIVNPAPGNYKWKVQAVNFNGTSIPSNVAEGPGIPSRPGDITVEVIVS